MPQCLWRTVDAGSEWYGTRFEPGEGLGATVTNGRKSRVATPKVRFTPEERLRDMDAQGIDVQVVSIHTPLFGYHLEPAQGRQLARDVNDEIAAMTRQWPRRFAGLATLPVQDVTAAIDALERTVAVRPALVWDAWITAGRSAPKLASTFVSPPAPTWAVSTTTA